MLSLSLSTVEPRATTSTISSLFNLNIVHGTTLPRCASQRYSHLGELCWMVDGTAKGVLQGFITDDYGVQHLARVAIRILPSIGRSISRQNSSKNGNRFGLQ